MHDPTLDENKAEQLDKSPNTGKKLFLLDSV